MESKTLHKFKSQVFLWNCLWMSLRQLWLSYILFLCLERENIKYFPWEDGTQVRRKWCLTLCWNLWERETRRGGAKVVTKMFLILYFREHFCAKNCLFFIVNIRRKLRKGFHFNSIKGSEGKCLNIFSWPAGMENRLENGFYVLELRANRVC